MTSLLPTIVRKTEAEAIYTRERQRANRERFRAYHADFREARSRGDHRRMAEVLQDVTIITSDTVRLVRRMRGIQTRLTIVR